MAIETPTGPRVRVFGTTYCGFCRLAEALLEKQGIPFEKIDVTGDAEARAELVKSANGRQTVPVIFVDGRPIGGYEELVRFIATQGF
ncbi:MAG TPA: glutaredoxin domain-containing protein [Polyangia bacterium]|nr:glutaredoxin domain-containing protein [Polyangia bacterium]